ncbi:UspA domain protein [Desulfonatronospira thiodismutans ASO3-1]|uniref:UspA domain protein n=1 Tax=Desulfonatronospira thiodismutans ASO3-1 TaxID=555779 RepID=D6SND1_9BACT|nr:MULTISPECIES: universal stress protein [Desulfonatronospira]EFI34257.1 UspA domain protein [Desulfonatronospira thiodismutans ASO3-1]RQD72853.1 MAG: universal stress protein [Desulfonatronospira sp. MSAO_Bac3]
MPEIKRMLLPVVFSENDMLAADYARQIAMCAGSEVDLVHVTPQIDFISEDILQSVYTSHVGYEKEVAEKLMDAFIEKSLSGVNVRNKAVLKGQPAEEVLRYAKENNINMIVLPTHTRKGPEAWFVGSVAERITKRAHCPVLIVHPD